jgi:hypothetical protein
LSIDDGCDASTFSAEFTVRNSKLPPGGGRAAGGGSSVGRRRRVTTQPSQHRGAKWLAVLSLGGAEGRFAVQMGKRVVFVDGSMCLLDVIEALKPLGGRSGDET